MRLDRVLDASGRRFFILNYSSINQSLIIFVPGNGRISANLDEISVIFQQAMVN